MKNIKLRPHHVKGLIDHEKTPEVYDMSPDDYVEYYKKFDNGFHSPELIKHWFNTLKHLHDNPNVKFKYVAGAEDTVCRACEHCDNCHDPNHENYGIVAKQDKGAHNGHTHLKIGKKYSVNDMKGR